MAEEEKTDQESKEEAQMAELRAGVWVFILLAVFTFGEFVVAVIAPPWAIFLLIVAFLKAVYVIKDYMHVGRLFRGTEETHS